MNTSSAWRVREIIFITAALVFILFLQGAIPFLMIPTLGQAVWGVGFSESFAHSSIFTIHAYDFGIPKPAAIAFGLAGAWPISLLLRLGLQATDAYAFIVMGWLSLAFFSAYIISRQCGNSRMLSTLGAVTWMSMPVIWYHGGYGFLSLGMSLLAFYFLMAMKLFCIETVTDRPSVATIILYFVAAVVAVFMDGYTFMMFFSGATIIFLFMLKTRVDLRFVLWRNIFSVHVVSFAVAYMLYVLFIGKSHYDHSSMDFFRAWGADLWFMVVPTQGIHWIPDVLGISVERPTYQYFGDSSVWKTTFVLPIFLAGFVSWLRIRKKTKIATAIFLVAIFGFYMSLGPSLKIHSLKPIEQQVNIPNQQSQTMPKKDALMPTGSALLSKHLPGFSEMRAAYRWTALEVLALWWVVMLGLANTQRKILWSGVLVVIILLNVPNLPKRLQMYQHNREMFLQIDQYLIPALQHSIQPNEVVAFLPWGNDFIANYLAPTAGFRTYNIGGDKNLVAAQHYWPQEMRAAGPAPLSMGKMAESLILLRHNQADVLIIPYFDLLWAPQHWPCGRAAKPLNSTEPYACLLPYKQSLQPLLQKLQATPDLQVTDTELFVIIRTKISQTPLSPTI